MDNKHKNLIGQMVRVKYNYRTCYSESFAARSHEVLSVLIETGGIYYAHLRDSWSTVRVPVGHLELT